jgi:surface antigen
MKFGILAARLALVAVCALMTVVPAQARFWQCAPYAREVSGIQIFGNANTWWSQAAGKYERGDVPKVGAVLSFRSTGKMRLGHVAMVAAVVSDREVLLNHANWSRRGGIERDVRAIDVSAAGDWSEVRVWFAGVGGLGTTTYPLFGFIRPTHDGTNEAVLAPTPAAEPLPPLTIATAAVVPVAGAAAITD